MQNQITRNDSVADHEAALELLPWFVNGSLSAAESAAVEQHLHACPDCRKQVRQLKTVTRQVADAAPVWKPSAAHFAGIMAGIDALPKAQQSKPDSRPAPGFFKQLTGWFDQTPLPVRWTLGLETVGFALMALLFFLPGAGYFDGIRGPGFETLSSVEPTANLPQGTEIKLMFSEDMSMRELTALLMQAGAKLRDGPSSVGVFSVEVAKQQTETALSLFRNHAKIRLSEVVVAPQTQ